MESSITDPLLLPNINNNNNSSNSSSRRKHQQPVSSFTENNNNEVFSVTIPIPNSPPPPAGSASLKDRLIWGPTLSSSTDLPQTSPESLPLITTTTISSPPPSPPPPPANYDDDDDVAVLSHYHPGAKTNLHRSRTAPAMSAINDAVDPYHPPRPSSSSSPRRGIVRQALLLLTAYLSLGVLIYTLNPSHFSSVQTHPFVDALYFCIVTMCTIGYGDITPATPSAKLFSITFVLVGFGFVDILLSATVAYVLDLQESLLLSAVKARARGHARRHNYLVDVKKGRMRIRMKVGLALGVVVLCIGLGTLVLCFVERLTVLDAFYLAVMSVTTVGYGDRAFNTLPGRLFASVWLLFSTLAVARAFLYLAEARIDKRHRTIAKWVLSRDMTVSEFLAADIDNNGFVSKSEFVIYKLKDMGKVLDKDIMQICDQFDRLDTGTCGKISLRELIESHHQHQ